MKNLILLLHLSLFCALLHAQLPVVVTCWQQNTTASGFAGELTNVQEVNYSDSFVYVKTNDIPSWIPIGYDWPNNPWFAQAMSYQFKFRRYPRINMGPETKTGYGHIGLWKNGCSIYNPKDAKSYKDSLVWFQNAWFFEHLLGETFDPCVGHPNGSGEYHTHATPLCLWDIYDSTHHAPLVGYAFDGYPIYGGYGYSNPMDSTSAVLRLKSSYRLRSISNRTVLPDGTILTPSHYGPLLDTFPLGAYMEDYEFVAGLGSLDIHNGRFCVTPEYPNGIYAYFTTIDWVTDTYGTGIKPVFPYVLGTAYYGKVFQLDGNVGPASGFVVIAEPVTRYLAPQTAIAAVNTDVKLELYPNPASNYVGIKVATPGINNKMFQLTIFSNDGTKIEEGLIDSDHSYLYSTAAMPNGMYYAKLSNSETNVVQKFIVAH